MIGSIISQTSTGLPHCKLLAFSHHTSLVVVQPNETEMEMEKQKHSMAKAIIYGSTQH